MKKSNEQIKMRVVENIHKYVMHGIHVPRICFFARIWQKNSCRAAHYLHKYLVNLHMQIAVEISDFEEMVEKMSEKSF